MEIFVTHLLKIKIFPKINKIVLNFFLLIKKRYIYFFLNFFFHVNLWRKKKNISSKMIAK